MLIKNFDPSKASEAQLRQVAEEVNARIYDLDKRAETKHFLGKMFRFYHGRARKHWFRQVVNCEVLPYIPKGWSIRPEDQIASRVRGQFDLGLNQIALYLDKGQKDGDPMVGYQLGQALEGRSVLPANVLDYLIIHSSKIKYSKKDVLLVCFWGTIYRDQDGIRRIRCLYWDGYYWTWNGSRLGDNFEDWNPAAVAAK